jgi:hypothetical protein
MKMYKEDGIMAKGNKSIMNKKDMPRKDMQQIEADMGKQAPKGKKG